MDTAGQTCVSLKKLLKTELYKKRRVNDKGVCLDTSPLSFASVEFLPLKERFEFNYQPRARLALQAETFFGYFQSEVLIRLILFLQMK